MRRLLKPDRLIPLGVAVVVLAAVILWLVFLSPAWLWHPLGVCSGTPAEVVRCKSYNFHSGIEGNIGELALLVGMVTALVTWWQHHNCHFEGCPWPGHPHPEHGRPTCTRHYNVQPTLGN